MKLSDVKRLTGALLDAAQYGIFLPICLWAPTGVGKTEGQRDLAAERKVGFLSWYIAQREATDITGMPFPQLGDDNGAGPVGTARTLFAKPEDFPDAKIHGEAGILLIDEPNRGRKDTRNALFQLLLERRVGPHKLPPGWIQVLACNPATADYQVDSMHDQAWQARAAHIEVHVDADEWQAHAAANGVDWGVRALLQRDATLLTGAYKTTDKGDPISMLPEGLRPCARKWTMLGRVLPYIPEDLRLEVAAGMVGQAGAAALATVRSGQSPVRAVDILDSYERVKSVVRKQAEPNSADLALLRVTFEDLHVECTKRADAGVLSSGSIDNLVAFLSDAPEDLTFGYLKVRFLAYHTGMTPFRAAVNQHPAFIRVIQRVRSDAGIGVL